MKFKIEHAAVALLAFMAWRVYVMASEPRRINAAMDALNSRPRATPRSGNPFDTW